MPDFKLLMIIIVNNMKINYIFALELQALMLKIGLKSIIFTRKTD